MATLKQRLHRKNATGYDVIHFETESSLVLRPSGRTVEQDLEDYLPKVQDNDTVPDTLKSGQLLTGRNVTFVGMSNKPQKLLTEKDTIDADSLNGHSSSDFVLKSEYTPVDLSGYLKTSVADTKYAAKSHTHSTSQITGLDTTLASKAPSVHTHTVDQITGVLPVSKGGTGVTSIDALKSALGLSENTTEIKTEWGISKDIISHYPSPSTNTGGRSVITPSHINNIPLNFASTIIEGTNGYVKRVKIYITTDWSPYIPGGSASSGPMTGTFKLHIFNKDYTYALNNITLGQFLATPFIFNVPRSNVSLGVLNITDLSITVMNITSSENIIICTSYLANSYFGFRCIVSTDVYS